MKNILINPATGRHRAGWRIFIYIFLLAGINAAGMAVLETMVDASPEMTTLKLSVLAIATTLVAWVTRRFVDKKAFISLGLVWDKYALPDLLSGIVNGALLMAGVFFTMLWAGLIEFHGLTWWSEGPPATASFGTAAMSAILIVFYEFTIVAWHEELSFRGYIFQNLVEGMGLIGAIMVSSLVFALAHVFNPGASILSSFLIGLITLLLIYAYLKTGQLWLPMGLHLGWNFFQASVFGFATSGRKSPSLVSQSPVGPEWLSGGAFGAEGSILIIPFLVLSLALIHFWVRATRQPGQKLLGIYGFIK
jgi:uncharacterized protein